MFAKIVKQHFATVFPYDFWMGKLKAREQLATSLRALMDHVPALSTQMKVAAMAAHNKCPVPQTSVSQALRPGNTTAKAPTLTTIEAIASAFDLEVWELLHPDCIALYDAKHSKHKRKAHSAALDAEIKEVAL